jgi:hypothetical protein
MSLTLQKVEAGEKSKEVRAITSEYDFAKVLLVQRKGNH